MTLAYFDCFSGISGDMTLGALIDLGVPAPWLKKRLSDIPLEPFEIIVKKEFRHGIRANRVEIVVNREPVSRNYAQIRELIEKSRLSPVVKKTSFAIFEKIAQAEAKIHDVAVEQVHFHEIGAVDSIVDIAGTALCLEYLGIEKVVSSAVPLGKGFVTCRHGTLPVPAPATMEILKHVPVVGGGANHELVTPTGAAIIAAIADWFGDMPPMEIACIGYGAGQQDLPEIPNLLRVVKGMAVPSGIGQAAKVSDDRAVMVETCIDDMNSEIFGYVMDRLFEDGALDVYWIPVFMKKNRPGTMIQVLCEASKKETIINRILRETTTIGVRFYEVFRRTLQRKIVAVQTKYGRVQAKCILDLDNRMRIVPEYDACRKIAMAHDIPIQRVYAEVSQTTPDESLVADLPDHRDEP